MDRAKRPDRATTTVRAARLTFNPGLSRMCYDVNVEGIEVPTAAHVNVEPFSVAGPVVIPIAVNSGPKPTHLSGSVNDVERSLLHAILTNPTGYYVNVHNAPFPARCACLALSGPSCVLTNSSHAVPRNRAGVAAHGHRRIAVVMGGQGSAKKPVAAS